MRIINSTTSQMKSTQTRGALLHNDKINQAFHNDPKLDSFFFRIENNWLLLVTTVSKINLATIPSPPPKEQNPCDLTVIKVNYVKIEHEDHFNNYT